MIKVSANILKKVPTPGVEFSTQAFGASMEIEVADAADPETVRERLRGVYQTISAAIDEQIARVGGRLRPPTRAAASARALDGSGDLVGGVAASGNGRLPVRRQVRSGTGRANGDGYGRTEPGGATQAQLRAISAIARNRNIELAEVLVAYRVRRAEELSVKDASRLIDQLKETGGGAAGAAGAAGR